MATTTRVEPFPGSARRRYWRAQVEAHRPNGLSQAAFCARQDLRKGTFTFWKWKVTREAGAGPGRGGALATRSAEAPAFVPIQITAGRAPRAAEAAPDGEVEIALGPDRCVRVRGRVDPAWLVQGLRGIEALGC
ncbi:MAG: hypothetical protein HY953_07610 [Candidatus Rokubacteria bacterium]|nr:hypothetical protein [Candidatus Rokubacteria bacterium]